MRTLKNLGGRVVPGRYRFKEPDKNKVFSTLRALVDFVREYRVANGISVGEDLQAEIEDWICHNIGSAWYYCMEDGKEIPQLNEAGIQQHANGYDGSKKWKELHEWCLSQPSMILELSAAGESASQELYAAQTGFMDSFTRSLPCGDCRRGWRKLLKESPPPFMGRPEHWWKWSWEAHKEIRRKLGQPIMDEAEALALYSSP